MGRWRKVVKDTWKPGVVFKGIKLEVGDTAVIARRKKERRPKWKVVGGRLCYGKTEVLVCSTEAGCGCCGGDATKYAPGEVEFLKKVLRLVKKNKLRFVED